MITEFWNELKALRTYIGIVIVILIMLSVINCIMFVQLSKLISTYETFIITASTLSSNEQVVKLQVEDGKTEGTADNSD